MGMQASNSRPGVLAQAVERWQVSLLVLLALGLMLRVAWALVIAVDPISDAHAYDIFATNLAQHGVYGWTPDAPGAYWPVGTSAIVAALYFVFGSGYTPVVILNIAVSVVVIWQVFLLARHYFDTATGLLAAALLAFWPSLIMYVTVIASEVFFLFFVLGGLLAFENRTRPIWAAALVAGLFWAAAVYVRPVALLLPLVFGVPTLLRATRTVGQMALLLAVSYFVIACAVAPWAVRNQAVFGEPVLVSTNFGPVFWMGNNPETTGEYQRLPDRVDGLSETGRAKLLKDEAMAYIAERPFEFLRRTAVKFVRLHERETIAVAWNNQEIRAVFGNAAVEVLKALASGFWFAVLLAALAGVVRLARRRGLWQMLIHPCFLGWMYFAWVHAVIILGDRYHFPAIPFIAVLGAFGLEGILVRTRGATVAGKAWIT